ncbi:MAG: class I lanthipeptide [Candidatus Aminicenantes bacterium]|nr:class I lanthipeptide [Candidatus Aminicenantes bacterium]
MKKLKIIRETVANLTDEQMQKIRGASVFHFSCDCNDTESCSVFYKCCPPPEENALVIKNFNP